MSLITPVQSTSHLVLLWQVKPSKIIPLCLTHYAFTAPDPPDFLSRYLMIEGIDYAQQTRTVNAIGDIKLRRIVCYNQTIYNDSRVELDKYAGLTLGVRHNYNQPLTQSKDMYDQASILILDNDSKCLTLKEM